MRAQRIKEQAEEFGIKVADFRQEFLKSAPFSYDVGDKCYEVIDAWNANPHPHPHPHPCLLYTSPSPRD